MPGTPPPPRRPPSDADRQARLLAAVADPSRLAIILLLRPGPLTVGQVAAAAGLPLVNASHHLGLLRQAGVALDRKRGRHVEYRLHPDVFAPAAPAGPGGVLNLGGLRLHLGA